MNSAAVFKQIAQAMASEGERKKQYENRLAASLEHAGEVLDAVRHLTLAAARAKEKAKAGPASVTSPSNAAKGKSADSTEDIGDLATSSMKASRIKSLSSIALSAGLGLPLTPQAPPKASAVNQAAPATNLLEDHLSQTARDLALLESELPTMRSLKSERFALIHAASQPVPQPPVRPFPLNGMIAELELARAKQNELAASHSAILAFLDNFPSILAQLKFRLCTRWARFSVGLSTGLYENMENIELLGTRMHDALQQVQKLYFKTRTRRAELLAPMGTAASASSTANAGASASAAAASSQPFSSPSSSSSSSSGISQPFAEELLRSQDMELYFRWIIPTLTASKEFNRFLIQCKWMSFQWPRQSAHTGLPTNPGANEILESYHALKNNPHVAEREEELRGLAGSETGQPQANPNAPRKSSLHTLLAETRAKLKIKRRYGLHLPCILLDEQAIHSVINRVGTLSLVTPLDYENGHPLLNQILKIFPALFEETSRRRSAVMRRSDSGVNIEMDRSAGVVYVKKGNWMPWMQWKERGVKTDRRNLLLREQLHSVSTLDAELVTENAFVDTLHLEFVLSRLKQLSSTCHSRIMLHLRTDTAAQSKMDAHLSGLRKNQHHIVWMNYTSVATPNGNVAPAAAAMEKKDANEDDDDETEEKKSVASSSHSSQKDTGSPSATGDSIAPPLPTTCALGTNVLVPPLPAVAFIPVGNGMAGVAQGQTVFVSNVNAATTSANEKILNANSNASATTAPPTAASLPAHKLHILFTLRFLRLRTLKDRVASILNFNRSIQRKLTLDQCGFGFEDRFQFNSEHIIRTVPHTAPAPLRAMEKMTNASSAASAASFGAPVAGVTMQGGQQRKGNDAAALHTVPLGHGLSTKLPRLYTHLASYLPSDYESTEEVFMSFSGVERRDDSYKWRSGREKHLDEWEGEIQVDDCCGVPIVYDVAQDDFDAIEEQLMALGTYVINEHRARAPADPAAASASTSSATASKNADPFSPAHSPASSSSLGSSHDVVDRWALLVDLWECESEFQVMKSRLMDIYLECYEHALTKEKQDQLRIKIVQLMDLRPYIELGQAVESPGGSRYFSHYYSLHCKLLSQQLAFLRGVLDWQMSHEKQQSKRWDAKDWRVWMKSEKQIKIEEREAGIISTSESSSTAPKLHSGVRSSAAKAEHQRSREMARSAAKMAREEKNKREGESEDEEDGDGSDLSVSDSEDEEAGQPQPSHAEDPPSGAPGVARDDRDKLLDQLSTLQIANSPSPFCRSFRVGMLDVLPSVGLVMDLLTIMEDTRDRLMSKCSFSSPGGMRPTSTYDFMIMDLAVLQHTSAAWTQHCQLKNSTLYDGSPHREILLSLEMSGVLHDPRAACAAIHSYSNTNIALEAAAVLSSAQMSVTPSEEKETSKDSKKDSASDAKNKLGVSAVQARRLKRLSNLVEIEDEEEADEEDDENASLSSPKKKLSSLPRAIKGQLNATAAPPITGGAGFAITVSEAAPAADSTIASPSSKSKSLASQRHSLTPGGHVELMVIAAQEKIKLLICVNLLEAVGMTSILLQQVFESHVLTSIYRRQAAAIGIYCVRSLIDPYAVAFSEASIEDGTALITEANTFGRQGSTFLLAIMEAEETLPIALKDFVKVEQHLRLDPYLFHGYDHSALGTSPAVTPGGPGRASPFDIPSRGDGGDSASGSSSWSARTSMMPYQPSGRQRRFFHRPNGAPAGSNAPPSSGVMRSMRKSISYGQVRVELGKDSGRSTPSSQQPSASPTTAGMRPGLFKASSLSLDSSAADGMTTSAARRAEEISALREPSAEVRREGKKMHRRSVSAGNLTTILNPSFSSTMALAAVAALKPLQIPRQNALAGSHHEPHSAGLTIELMEDPLLASTRRKKAESNEDRNNSDSPSDSRITPTRPRSQSSWQIPTFAHGFLVKNGAAGGTERIAPDASDGVPIKGAGAESPATDTSPMRVNITSPNGGDRSIPSPSTPRSSATPTPGSVPQSVMDATAPSPGEAHLARAQRRSLLEAQKSRAREKVRRARVQRVQAEREIAEEEKARRDALTAEEPKELCELWLLAFRRIVQAQVAHKHALTVAVQFHDLLSEQEDSAIEYLPPTSLYSNSSVGVALLQQRARPGTGQSDAFMYQQGPPPSSASVRPSDISYHYNGSQLQTQPSARPQSPGLSYPRVGLQQPSGTSLNTFGGGPGRSLSISIANSQATSLGTTPYNRSSTASPSPYGPSGDASTTLPYGSTVTEICVGCLTPRTFLFLDGLKKSLFESFQARQHFNYAQVGITHAVAGLASAKELEHRENKPGFHRIHSRTSSMGTHGSMLLSAPTPAAGGQQMLWLRTKKDQDQLDGQSLHVYTLDVINALSVHVYILETALLAQKFAFIHTVTLAGTDQPPSMPKTVDGVIVPRPQPSESELISPFTLSVSSSSSTRLVSGCRSQGAASSSQPPATASSSGRPSSKYARIRALPGSVPGTPGGRRPGTGAAGDGAAGDAGDSRRVDPSDPNAALVDLDDLAVEDLFPHVNGPLVDGENSVHASAGLRTLPASTPLGSGLDLSSGSSGSGSARKQQKKMGQSGGSRASLASSASGSAKVSRTNSVRSLHVPASTNPQEIPSVVDAPTSSPTATASSPSPSPALVPLPAAAPTTGSVAVLLETDDGGYTDSASSDESDDEFAAANDLLDEQDEQFLMHSAASMGRVRADGTRIASSTRSSTSFLFRIPRLAALLALLQDHRIAVLNIDSLKLDLLARTMLLDLFHLCHSAVCLEALEVLSQPITVPPNVVDGSDANEPPTDPKHPSASAPQMYAAFQAQQAAAGSAGFASPPGDVVVLNSQRMSRR